MRTNEGMAREISRNCQFGPEMRSSQCFYPDLGDKFRVANQPLNDERIPGL
jgi:hypothetical protein